MDAQLHEAWDDVSRAALNEAQGDPVHQRQEGLEGDPLKRSCTPREQDRERPLD